MNTLPKSKRTYTPALGWWDRRDDMQLKELPFSLIVSIVAPGIHAAVQAALPTVVPIEISQ